jgi:thiamine pyrophosphokinase
MADRNQVLLFPAPARTMIIEFHVRPLVLSLLPLDDRCEGVDLSGVRWPLTGARIAQAHPFAVSNRVTDGRNRVELRCAEGRLGIYAVWEDPGEPGNEAAQRREKRAVKRPASPDPTEGTWRRS